MLSHAETDPPTTVTGPVEPGTLDEDRPLQSASAGVRVQRMREAWIAVVSVVVVTAYVTILGAPLLIYANGLGLPGAVPATLIPLVVLIADGSRRTRRVLIAWREASDRQGELLKSRAIGKADGSGQAAA